MMAPEEDKARIKNTLFGNSLSADAMEREHRLFQECSEPISAQITTLG